MSKLFALVAAATIAGAQAQTCLFGDDAQKGVTGFAAVSAVNTADQGLAAYNTANNVSLNSTDYTALLYCDFGVAFAKNLNAESAKGCNVNYTAYIDSNETAANASVLANLGKNIPEECNVTIASLFDANLSGSDIKKGNTTDAPTSGASSVEAGLLAGVAMLAAALTF